MLSIDEAMKALRNRRKLIDTDNGISGYAIAGGWDNEGEMFALMLYPTPDRRGDAHLADCLDLDYATPDEELQLIDKRCASRGAHPDHTWPLMGGQHGEPHVWLCDGAGSGRARQFTGPGELERSGYTETDLPTE